MFTFYEYPKCSTCRRAKAELQELGVELEIQRVPDIAPEDINKLWS